MNQNAATDWKVMLSRGMRLRCPNCGGAGLFHSWFRLRETCPTCHLRLNRGEHDFFIGAYTANFIAAEVGFALLLTMAIILAWPAVPWTVVLWGGAAGIALMPLLFFPFSRTVWLALDLAFQPPRPSDFAS